MANRPKDREAQGEQVSWRIPPDLKAEVDAMADADLRTINAEVIILLREALAARKKPAASGEELGQGQKIRPETFREDIRSEGLRPHMRPPMHDEDEGK